MFVLASLRLRDVVDYWDEAFVKGLDNEIVRENGLTARDSVISDTAQRIAVHRPNEYRFARFGRFDPSVPQVVTPADFSPLLFTGSFGQPIENDFEIVKFYLLVGHIPEIGRSNVRFAF